MLQHLLRKFQTKVKLAYYMHLGHYLISSCYQLPYVRVGVSSLRVPSMPRVLRISTSLEQESGPLQIRRSSCYSFVSADYVVSCSVLQPKEYAEIEYKKIDKNTSENKLCILKRLIFISCQY